MRRITANPASSVAGGGGGEGGAATGRSASTARAPLPLQSEHPFGMLMLRICAL